MSAETEKERNESDQVYWALQMIAREAVLQESTEEQIIQIMVKMGASLDVANFIGSSGSSVVRQFNKITMCYTAKNQCKYAGINV